MEAKQQFIRGVKKTKPRSRERDFVVQQSMWILFKACYCVGLIIVSAINVTEAVRDNALPFKDAPVAKVIPAYARIVPFILAVVPKVAELPTCQKMLEAFALPIRIT